MPKLSLVTGARNRPEAFARLLDSICARTVVDWELIVGDASDVGLEATDPRVQILRETPPLGHSRGYNAAFRHCLGDFIIWLNDDAEVCEGYDVEAIAFMEAHPSMGLGVLHYSENGGPFHVNSAWGVPYANFGIFRRWLGQQVGFFDEDIEMYGADNSFAFRILLEDFGIADIPNARILHHSEKDNIRTENQLGRNRDNRMLQEKYMPLRRKWTAAYQRHRIPTVTEPWAHGRRPEMART